MPLFTSAEIPTVAAVFVCVTVVFSCVGGFRGSTTLVLIIPVDYNLGLNSYVIANF